MLILAALQTVCSLLRSSVMCLRGHALQRDVQLQQISTNIDLAYCTLRIAWSLVALTDCWYSQLSNTSAGGGGKGSPSSPVW